MTQENCLWTDLSLTVLERHLFRISVKVSAITPGDFSCLSRSLQMSPRPCLQKQVATVRSPSIAYGQTNFIIF